MWSWSLTEDERKDPGKIFVKFMEQLEPSENYRISRLKLMHFRHQQDDDIEYMVCKCGSSGKGVFQVNYSLALSGLPFTTRWRPTT